ncbi:pectate lyase [Tundrisphaera sp. TA3]|uniref:pectate lyase n=1 Tax=Tundrisphaera sp. TA3 TaxID=3435775 RepID=UPI003EBA7914
MMRLAMIGIALVALGWPSPGASADEPLREQAAAALRLAAGFYRERVAVEGGYVFRYSEDLARREGEERVGAKAAWLQAPGTPAVGMAYLDAFAATGDAYYRDAATETARALVRGQLRSGGWDDRIEFEPAERERFAYRVDPERPRARNVTTLDDDKTQSAVRFLLRADKALEFQDAAIHEATRYALDHLIAAQYPNGAWPQRFDAPPDPARFPVKPAGYPETWPRTYTKAKYDHFYTLNDGTQADMVALMLDAWRQYQAKGDLDAALRGGEFFLLAQMPAPQPAWAQQYDAEMRPTWARKFEPPAITGGESIGAMRALLGLYHETGDGKYLKPIPPALDYLRGSRLPDGQLARFYELKTNRPLFFTRDYQLTYDDADVPTHYAFKVNDGTATIARDYERALAKGPVKPGSVARKPGRPPEDRVRAVIAALDDQGRWVEEGRLRTHGKDDPTRRVIEGRTFVRNAQTLSQYLLATKP